MCFENYYIHPYLDPTQNLQIELEMRRKMIKYIFYFTLIYGAGNYFQKKNLMSRL